MGPKARWLSIFVVTISVLLMIFNRFIDKDGANNVCPTINDYLTIAFNSKCWYDADVSSNVTQIISNHGYESETHEVTTDDGYILTLFRIVNGKSKTVDKGPVVLQHGASGSCIGFFGLGNESLAFLLAEAGYDVWLVNIRGNVYSQKHLTYDAKKDAKYWDHSFHEIAIYDVRTYFRYIKSKSKDRKIVYIGVSMGSILAFVYASTFPQESKDHIKSFIFMCPTMSSANRKGINYVVLGPVLKTITETLPESFLDLHMGVKEGDVMMKPLVPTYIQIHFYSLIFKILDYLNCYTIKPETLPKLLSHNPGGGSVKILVHLFNSVHDFRMFDYGKEKNMQVYGTELPPKYDLSNIQVPMHMYYSANDGLVLPEDIALMAEVLPKNVTHWHKIESDHFTHMDFVYGAESKTLLYDRIIKLIAEDGS